jgi:hypothetical protein
MLWLPQKMSAFAPFRRLEATNQCREGRLMISRIFALSSRWRFERPISRVSLLRCLLIAALCASPVFPAFAHDFWDNKQRVDPATKQLCCGKNDCRKLEPSDVHQVDDGWEVLDLQRIWRIVGLASTLPSPDGKFYVCEYGWGIDPETPRGHIKCFFAPLSS